MDTGFDFSNPPATLTYPKKTTHSNLLNSRYISCWFGSQVCTCSATLYYEGSCSLSPAWRSDYCTSSSRPQVRREWHSIRSPPPPPLQQNGKPLRQSATSRRPGSHPLSAPAVFPNPSEPPTQEAPNRFLPLAFLLAIVLRPSLVFIRVKNPTRRFLINRDGLFMFWYRRGPHRIWLCRSAGCADIADVGTISATVPSAATVDAVGVVKDVWRRVVGRLAKMLDAGVDVLGRRVGREEKDLENHLISGLVHFASRDTRPSRRVEGEWDIPRKGRLSCNVAHGGAEGLREEEARHGGRLLSK